MPVGEPDSILQTLQTAYRSITNPGAFNQGSPDQVSGDQLPPEAKARVDALAQVRDSLERLDGPEALKQKKDLQEAINLLYNPRTRDAALASWAQLGGDETDPWSATGGKLGVAAGYVNKMTLEPKTNLYGGQRGGPEVPPGARVVSGQ